MTAIATSLPPPDKDSVSMLSSEQLKSFIEEEGKKRELFDQYIRKNLTKGTDFDAPFPGAKKMNLLKPGSEKVCSLLNIIPRFEVDRDMQEIFSGNEILRGKVICMVCILTSRITGEVVGEGRGAARLDEKNINGNINSAIKIAQKRAQVDSVLRLGALSDRFTQDAEDFKYPPLPPKIPAPKKIVSVPVYHKGKVKNVVVHPKTGKAMGEKDVVDGFDSDVL